MIYFNFLMKNFFIGLLVAVVAVGVVVLVKILPNQITGGSFSSGPDVMGPNVSTTVLTIPVNNLTLAAPARTYRVYAGIFNDTTSTMYVYWGPTSTPISLGSSTSTPTAPFGGLAMPIYAGGKYEWTSQNNYSGAISIATSTNNPQGKVIFIEKFR